MGVSQPFSAPTLLTETHDIDRFDCGTPALNDWLRRRALINQLNNASRTFVACAADAGVVAYYSLATGSVERSFAPGSVRRNMPDPIPVIVLGRLAVDQSAQGKGLGKALLRDAMFRVVRVSTEVAVRALVVHALTGDVVPFYRSLGFMPAEGDPLLLFLPIQTIVSALG